MKNLTIKSKSFFRYSGIVLLLVLLLTNRVAIAQTEGKDSTDNSTVAHKGPVKNTFESNWIIDDQTVMVPSKGTLEWDKIKTALDARYVSAPEAAWRLFEFPLHEKSSKKKKAVKEIQLKILFSKKFCKCVVSK